jgi:hypothetical protein
VIGIVYTDGPTPHGLGFRFEVNRKFCSPKTGSLVLEKFIEDYWSCAKVAPNKNIWKIPAMAARSLNPDIALQVNRLVLTTSRRDQWADRVLSLCSHYNFRMNAARSQRCQVFPKVHGVWPGNHDLFVYRLWARDDKVTTVHRRRTSDDPYLGPDEDDPGLIWAEYQALQQSIAQVRLDQVGTLPAHRAPESVQHTELPPHPGNSDGGLESLDQKILA